jgi:hypothetical protein
MTIEVDTILGPAHYASYLVNDDHSALSEAEVEEADRWCDSVCEGGWRIVATNDNDGTWYTRSYGLTTRYVLHRTQ